MDMVLLFVLGLMILAGFPLIYYREKWRREEYDRSERRRQNENGYAFRTQMRDKHGIDVFDN